MTQVRFSRHGDIAIAIIENPPVNALSLAVRQGLMQAIADAQSDPGIKALILIGGGKTFVAGADINDFGKPYVEPSLYAIIDALHASAKPVVAAIHGTALGGGLELALNCHWRVALADAQVGQPEVTLGLMPGGGGTQWWPRLAGVAAALDICTSGKPIKAGKAHELGAIDRIVEGDLLTGAIDFARELVATGRGARRPEDFFDKCAGTDSAVFTDFRERNRRKWRGLLAPWKIVDCIEAACRTSFAEGFALEKAAFQACEHSAQSRALIHLFFAEREAAKLAGASAELRPAPIKSIAVVGAGTMGGGIAMACAAAGLPVTLLEVSEQALARGLDLIRRNYAASVKRGSLAQDAAERLLALIRPTTRYEDLASADLAIEAVFEDMGVKQQVFRQLAAVMRPDALLASNTSMLDIDAIASVVPNPERVLGLHFFSPANVMKLLEIVRGAKTSAQTLVTALGVARMLRKIAVVAGNAEGFIGNRIMAAYGRETDRLLLEGATPWQIDQVLTDFGFAMGIYAVRDLAGLDLIWSILSKQPREATNLVVERIHALGRHGQKSGAGYYRYEGRNANADPEIESLIAAISAELGIARRAIGDAEILERILGSMAGEGERILAEGIAQRASDIDVVYVHGYGFPAYRGGPMFFSKMNFSKNIASKIGTGETLVSPVPPSF